jgi:deoxycytidylate deaminase
MHKNLLSAINLAKNYKFDRRLGYHHCALIVRGGSILAVGYNGLNVNTFIDYLSDYDKTPRPFINRHSEVDAILSVRNKIDLRGSKLFVIRLKADGVVGMSAPCASCQHAARQYGIKRVIYSIDNNTYGTMKIL